ncbi:chitin-binding type-2 domain-containing protein [Trichonephila inaurata madagascariensis]|uniref:Chitin-binding type-2 domain-containing protein n=1 Tax=Trichonephila inaurata madagascariensis TaxID=2747483 RepID=A0A8X6WMG2_9ARAC|nr:chitin-binding type-2 domain-containing protein [Trichonephila inaurata madagascariensis]
MHHLYFISALLLCSSAVYGLTLPSENVTHPDVKIPAEYNMDKSKMLTVFCPMGMHFDAVSSSCVDFSTYDNSLETLHRRKRSDIIIHSISKEKLKQGALKFMETMESTAMDILEDIAPSLHRMIETDYKPTINSIKNDILPMLNTKSLSQVQKVYDYSKNLAERVFRKLYQSWEQSNSTHLNVVSFSDIAQDVHEDLKPYLTLSRFLSGSMSKTRSKRSVGLEQSIHQIISPFVEPFMKGAFKFIANAVTGGQDPFFNQLVVPIVDDMMADPRTMNQLQQVFWMAKYAYGPVAFDFISSNLFSTNGVGLSRQTEQRIKQINFSFFMRARPIFEEILKRHAQMILRRCAQNTKVIFWKLDRIHKYSGKLVMEVKKDLFAFFVRHAEHFIRDDFDVESFSNMKKDLNVIKPKLLQISIDYFSRSPNSLVRLFFSRNSV